MLKGCEEFEEAIRKFVRINFLKDEFKCLADIEKVLGEDKMKLFLELSDLASKMYHEGRSVDLEEICIAQEQYDSQSH